MRYHRTGRESYSDTHSVEDNITAYNDSDTVSANCWPTVPVVHRFTGSSSWLQKTEQPHMNKDPSPLSVLTASFIHKPTKKT